MNNIKNGKVPTTWPFDGTPVNYQRWDTYDQNSVKNFKNKFRNNGFPENNKDKTSLIVGVIQVNYGLLSN